jgi:hypothetical protein
MLLGGRGSGRFGLRLVELLLFLLLEIGLLLCHWLWQRNLLCRQKWGDYTGWFDSRCRLDDHWLWLHYYGHRNWLWGQRGVHDGRWIDGRSWAERLRLESPSSLDGGGSRSGCSGLRFYLGSGLRACNACDHRMAIALPIMLSQRGNDRHRETLP